MTAKYGMARSEFTPAEMLLSTKQEVADSHQSLKQEIREGRLGIYACGNAIIDEAGRLNEKPRPIKKHLPLAGGRCRIRDSEKPSSTSARLFYHGFSEKSIEKGDAMNSVLLDRRDSAKYLGISVSNLDRLRAAGELPAVQYRRKGNVRYREEDLKNFIEQRVDKRERGRADFCPSFRGGNGKRGRN